MTSQTDSLAVVLFSEIFTVDQMARNRLTRALPKGMELSHFSVLNYLARVRDERTPADLARVFHVTRGAMTNTLSKLERAGYIHVRPDWNDARRKFVTISPDGRRAFSAAMCAVTPIIAAVVDKLGATKVRAALPILRELRAKLNDGL